MNNECTFVILGATGDLTKRKLIPAIYHLIKDKKIHKISVIGAARTKTTIEKIIRNAQKFIPRANKEILKKLKSVSYYTPLDFYKTNDYEKLKTIIEQTEKKHNLCGNRIFYLATLPQHFQTITQHLASHKIVCKSQKTPWTRIVYEKPFGHDLKSARKIDRCITNLFDESQIYRIDHFLWEELIGNIALLRFTNLFFEPLWNRKYIESVQIILNEAVGIEGRGAFYDRYGTLRDVVQNHMLQMLALIAMEPPKRLTGTYVRNNKAAVLKKISCEDVVLGQYRGYKNVIGVHPKSRTDTFAALKLSIHNRRWQGVPFYLKTGKALPQKETSIHVQFKKSTCLQDACPMEGNTLSIQINPREGFFLTLNAKSPGAAYEITPAKMEFCHPCLFGPNTPQAYESLLSDILEGDQSVFLRFDEIEHSWKLIDKIHKEKHAVYTYKKKSNGPKELEQFCKTHNMRWKK